MRTLEVTTPEGRDWTVRVVWQPRWRHLARRFGGWRRKRRSGEDGKGSDIGSAIDVASAFDEFFGVIVAIIGLILFGLLFWFLLLPLALLLVDIVVVILLMLLAIPARVLFRRPWTVEAASPGAQAGTEDWFATEIVGWRKALAARDDLAGKLTSGQSLGALATREI